MQEVNLYGQRMLRLEEGDELPKEPKEIYFHDSGNGRLRFSVFINGTEISQPGYVGMSDDEAKEKISWLQSVVKNGWLARTIDGNYKCLYCNAEADSGPIVQLPCPCRSL